MNVSRTKLIKKIYDRLVELEAANNNPYVNRPDIDAEMKKLRIRLQDLMNSKCPIFGGVTLHS